MLEVDMSLMRAAGAADPVFLRTADAIHVAALLSLRDEIGVVVTYDERLVGAARQHNLVVVSPS